MAKSKSVILNVKCGNCKREVSDDFLYCPWCSVKFAGDKCKKCGEKIEKGDKFCVACGRVLGK